MAVSFYFCFDYMKLLLLLLLLLFIFIFVVFLGTVYEVFAYILDEFIMFGPNDLEPADASKDRFPFSLLFIIFYYIA